MATMRKAGATLPASTTYNGIFMTFSVFPTVVCPSVRLCVCVSALQVCNGIGSDPKSSFGNLAPFVVAP